MAASVASLVARRGAACWCVGGGGAAVPRRPAPTVVRRYMSSSLRPVFVAGASKLGVRRNQPDTTLAGLGGEAVREALADADVDPSHPGALFVGNMLSGMLSEQQHLGVLVANAGGMTGVEALTAEACCGAGGAALRLGYMAVAGGLHETVVVAGVEHMSHTDLATTTHGLATASHWETEGSRGETFVSLNGLMMKHYMARYGVEHNVFAPFSINAHYNASLSSHAVFRNKILTDKDYNNSRVISDPITLHDASPICDGAAAVVLTSNSALCDPANSVLITGSAASTDQLAVSQREDPLHLSAVANSTKQALAQARLSHADVDIFELHDAYSIMACLSLESAGFVQPGEGPDFAARGDITRTGRLPIATSGGLKARGHPVGATGVYQVAEMTDQLRGRAGENQCPRNSVTMVQNIGGSGASVFSHVLVKA
eukprot:m.24130 g.24130  ORF g.24130 m.24130 type:complete len:430 (+) comp7397_c0_seq1:190-1479(+)